MRKAAAGLAIMLLPLFLFLLPACSKGPRGAASGSQAPDFTVQGLDGSTLKLSDLRGSVVFVNFWATWCDSCKMEKPYLNQLYNKFKDNQRFRFVSVLYNDDPAAAKSYLEQHNYNIPVYTDMQGVAAVAYGLTGVPESFIIDKKGVLREKVIGPMRWDSPEVSAYMESLLKE